MTADRISSRVVTGALVGAAAGLLGGLCGAPPAKRTLRQREYKQLQRQYEGADEDRAVGHSDVVSAVPDELKRIMQSNSKAVDQLTNKACD